MYHYDETDKAIVHARVKQFRGQTERFLAGQLSEDDFRPLRLQNGLYIQRHAPMLRIAIPYGMLSSTQLRALASVTQKYDRGTGHFTTRQNLQLNWVALPEVPNILEDLANVEMHAIQTSGNCIRNITTDHFAGVAADEIADPRPWAEVLRQWSTFHPEFAYLPRKFKIAISGTTEDRTAIRVHDVGLQIVKNDAGEIGFTVYAGGGLGRTPLIGQKMIDFLPWQHLLTYTEALVRVYNRYGRRDNPYKARIKILVKALGSDEFSRQVAEEWAHIKDGPNTLTAEEVARVAKQFSAPSYDQFTAADLASIAAQKNEQASDKAFARWLERNVHAHKVPGYAAVTLSLKTPGVAPGDATVAQMQTAADLADEYSFGELRVAHEQNLVLSDVPQKDLYAVWQKAKAAGLASANIGLLADMIVCPGGDFCSLANAKSLPIAAAIHERFSDLDYLFDIGELALNISGCMNSCGHHHLGAIGILGVDKHGEEWYQITLGGAQGNAARIGEVIGRSFAATEIPDVIERMITTYLALRQEDESFGEAVARLGLPPFREAAYRKNETAGEPAHV
ncbi:MAG TPA: nitrite/sulfite reductase [Rugosibacter sp.]|nr:nitrite/sulfite reductase [Rugosibacter sp.]HQQ35750.1 nitrite/sulfite reductase [Rugosibacter sp.]